MTVRRSSMEKTADLLAGYLPLLRLQGSPQRAQTQESRGFGEFATTLAGPGPCRSPRVAPEIVVKRRRTYPRHLSPATNVGATHISAQVPQPIRRTPELHSLLGSALHGDMVGKGSTGYVGTCGQARRGRLFPVSHVCARPATMVDSNRISNHDGDLDRADLLPTPPSTCPRQGLPQ